MKEMSRFSLVLLVAGLLVLAGCAQNRPDQRPQGFELMDVGFETPESILHDEVADVYLVSNINGNPAAKDDNGFISRVSPDGQMSELKWIDGAAEDVMLNAPKGLAIVGDRLYVADIDHVRMFNRTTGAPEGEVMIEGGTFVNDIAPAPDGGVYVSDSGIEFTEEGMMPTGSAAVMHISPDGEVMTLASGDSLMAPNGLVMAEQGLIMVPFGGAQVTLIQDDMTTETLGTSPGGSLDGVVEARDGRLIFSSWETSSIYTMDDEGAIRLLYSELPSPADIGYDAERDLVLVPIFNENRIVTKPAGSAIGSEEEEE